MMANRKENWKDAKLIIFAMDGVLTPHPSSWTYVHERLGVDNGRNYELFRERRISYTQFLKSDVELWETKLGKVRKNQIEAILAEIPFSRNLRNTVTELKSQGLKAAIVSGGISWLADMINREVEFDYSYSNSIFTRKDGTLLPDGPAEVDPYRKDVLVLPLQEVLGISRDATISVGDSEQDIPMFRNSGISIGFNPMTEEVVRNSDISIRSSDLHSIITELDKLY